MPRLRMGAGIRLEATQTCRQEACEGFLQRTRPRVSEAFVGGILELRIRDSGETRFLEAIDLEESHLEASAGVSAPASVLALASVATSADPAGLEVTPGSEVTEDLEATADDLEDLDLVPDGAVASAGEEDVGAVAGA
jgi:hypothetical protein